MDIYLKISATLPLEIVEKVLMVIEDEDIVPISATLPTIYQVTMVYCCVYLLLLIVSLKLFMKMKEVTVVVMMQDMKLCLKITATINFTITDKVLKMMGDVDIGLK